MNMSNNNLENNDTLTISEIVRTLKEIGCRNIPMKYKQGERQYNIVFTVMTAPTGIHRKTGHYYVHVRRLKEQHHEYQFVTYPFQAKAFYPLIKDIKGITPFETRALSGYDTYPKIDENGKEYAENGKADSGLGYAYAINTKEGLIALVRAIRKGIHSGELTETYDKGQLRQKLNIMTHFKNMNAL